MGHIYYFTSSQDIKSFENELKNFTVVPNLSNQNFHNKMIRCLSLINDVIVISYRPINKTYKNNKIKSNKIVENNIEWNYLTSTKSKLIKFLKFGSEISKLLSSEGTENDYIFVDTLNKSLLKAAIKFKKKSKAQIIGVCTDNPLNISFVSDNYKNYILNKSQNLDGYICLTEEINKLFNINNKKYLVIDGLTESVFDNRKPIINDKYIYFGGSLMKEYGVNNLINAYKKLNLRDTKLVIAGHHETRELLDIIKDNKNIIYLKGLSYYDNINLQQNAICCVNPRPIESKIDLFSFPSKVLEYIACGSLTVSTMSPIIENSYSDAIIWAKSSNEIDLYNSIKKALSLSEVERKKLIKNAQALVKQRTSLERVAQLIKAYLLNWYSI